MSNANANANANPINKDNDADQAGRQAAPAAGPPAGRDRDHDSKKVADLVVEALVPRLERIERSAKRRVLKDPSREFASEVIGLLEDAASKGKEAVRAAGKHARDAIEAVDDGTAWAKATTGLDRAVDGEPSLSGDLGESIKRVWKKYKVAVADANTSAAANETTPPTAATPSATVTAAAATALPPAVNVMPRSNRWTAAPVAPVVRARRGSGGTPQCYACGIYGHYSTNCPSTAQAVFLPPAPVPPPPYQQYQHPAQYQHPTHPQSWGPPGRRFGTG